MKQMQQLTSPPFFPHCERFTEKELMHMTALQITESGKVRWVRVAEFKTNEAMMDLAC